LKRDPADIPATRRLAPGGYNQCLRQVIGTCIGLAINVNCISTSTVFQDISGAVFAVEAKEIPGTLKLEARAQS